MMTDKTYPEWEPKQRLEIARNQFIQGIESPSIQLVLANAGKAKDIGRCPGACPAASRCGDSPEAFASPSVGAAYCSVAGATDYI